MKRVQKVHKLFTNKKFYMALTAGFLVVVVFLGFYSVKNLIPMEDINALLAKIEQLESANAQLNEQISKASEEIDRLTAENVSLKEEIQLIRQKDQENLRRLFR